MDPRASRSISAIILALTIAMLALAGCTHGLNEDNGAFEALAPGAPHDAIVLRETLGRTWRNELTSCLLGRAQQEFVRRGAMLVDSNGREVIYQPNDPAAPSDIVFHFDLAPFETRAYRLLPRTNSNANGVANTPSPSGPASSQPAPARPGDLKIEQTDDVIRLSNSFTGIAIRKRFTPGQGQGPIAGIMLPSGKWVGDSQFVSPKNLQEAVSVTRANVRVNGSPAVHAYVECNLDFNTGDPASFDSAWISFRLDAHEPVIRISENWGSWEEHPAWLLTLDDSFPADHLFYRRGSQDQGGYTGKPETLAVVAPHNEPLFTLEPWLHWQQQVRQGNWVALYSNQSPDMLTFGAIRPSAWFKYVDGEKGHRIKPLTLRRWNKGYALEYPGVGRLRHTILAFTPRDLSLEALKETYPSKPPLPQSYVIKHGDFPGMEWLGAPWNPRDEDNADYPRLIVQKKDLPRLRAGNAPDPAQTERLLRLDWSPHNFSDPLGYWLRTGDPKIGRKMCDEAIKAMQQSVDMYLNQTSLVTLGFAPHHQTIVIHAAFLTDAALGTGQLTPQERQRLLSQAYFLLQTVSRDDYWSPRYGFSANPNMTTTVAAYQATLACLLPSRKMTRYYLDKAMHELYDVQLKNWSDDNGGWLEAPHYAMVSYDHLLGVFLMTHNAGFNDYIFDPKMKKVAQWFAKISTPPDTLRLNGWRRQPAIGNTYQLEPTGEYGVIASIWKNKDPKFAAEMQWMHKQSGSYAHAGVGGFFPTLAAHYPSMIDPSIPEKMPNYGSELFPKTGVILRSHFGTDRETQLHMIQGSNHDHYDADSGSITLWGMGRVLADDFGYYGYAPAEDHSMVEGASAVGGSIMKVSDFKSTPEVDYVCGTKQGWTRQIMMIKDEDKLGPNYFVVTDTLTPGQDGVNPTATWRLWLHAKSVSIEGNQVRVEGKEDVDLDIVFVDRSGMSLALQDKTCMSGSSYFQRREPTTQTGLIGQVPAIKGGAMITWVAYPRLKTQRRPEVSPHLPKGAEPAMPPMQGGMVIGAPAWAARGILRVEHDRGTDYIVQTTRKTSQELHIAHRFSFEGTAGVARKTAQGNKVMLFAPGKITLGDATMELK